MRLLSLGSRQKHILLHRLAVPEAIADALPFFDRELVEESAELLSKYLTTNDKSHWNAARSHPFQDVSRHVLSEAVNGSSYWAVTCSEKGEAYANKLADTSGDALAAKIADLTDLETIFPTY